MTFPHGPGPQPRTTLGLSGLGAVGGARGVGAGALRVIVEFVTQYDAEKVKELEAQLKKLENFSQLSDARSAKAAKALARDEALLNNIRKLRLTLSSKEAKDVLKLRDHERTRGQHAIEAANTLRTTLVKTTKLREDDLRLLTNQDKLENSIAARQAKRRAAEGRERDRQGRFLKAQVVAERQSLHLQQLRTQLVPKLGSLALGALGGIVGGAIVGVGFAAAQAGIELVGQALRDIFDPANKARDALKGVAAEVNKIADKEGITLLEAAKKRLEEFGEGARGISPELLAAATAVQTFVQENEELAAIIEITNNLQTLQREQINKYIRTLIEARDIGNLPFGGKRLYDVIRTGGDVTHLTTQEQNLYNEALERFGIVGTNAAVAARQLAAANDRVAGAAQRATYAEEQFTSAIRKAANLRISGLQDQISGLSDAGPSARTRALTAEINGMAEAQARSAFQSQISALAEQRTLLLLERRIRFQGQSVNLDALSGKAALVAIDARIAALSRAGQLEQRSLDLLNERISLLREADSEQDKRDQAVLKGYDDRIAAIRKEGDEQDRFNQLLDLQFEMNKTIKRQTDESIEDFLQRRAQENRDLLARQAELSREDQIGVIERERDAVAAIQETADARREAAIEELELQQKVLQAALEASQRARDAEAQALSDRRDRIALEVELEENAAQQAAVREQEAARQRSRLLQKQLEEAQEADQKELESKRKALEAQIRAIEDSTDEALKWASRAEQGRLRIALQGAGTYADAQSIIGELAGSRRALSELQAWAKAAHIPTYLSDQILGPLRELIRQAEAKVGGILKRSYGDYSRVGGFQETENFAHGGVINLSNARSPFGQNVRFGEQGREIGVILSNKVAQVLKEQTQPQAGESTYIINRSQDPYRDKIRFKQAVREVLGEVLR